MKHGSWSLTNNLSHHTEVSNPARRQALELLCVAGVLIVGSGSFNLLHAGSLTEFEMLRHKLSAVFTNIPGAKRLGVLYLEQHPTGIGFLFAQLRDAATEDTETFVRLIDARRVTDFASGRTVVLDGWVLAESEAQVCAFLSLT